MIYQWRCRKCSEIIEVDRPALEYKRGPEGDELHHNDCTSTEFRRILSIPKQINIPENEDVYWDN